MHLFGDIHGKTREFYELYKSIEPGESIQLGDLGFKKEHEWFKNVMDVRYNKVLFGNHDYYPGLNESYSLGNYGMYKGMFYIRGGFSIDRAIRTEGLNWWANEELSMLELYDMLEEYNKAKPEIVISHECPAFLQQQLWNITNNSRTAQAMDQVIEAWQPRQWIFAHHHKATEVQVARYPRTHWICLDELEYYKI
jgi:hypothetical protein